MLELLLLYNLHRHRKKAGSTAKHGMQHVVSCFKEDIFTRGEVTMRFWKFSFTVGTKSQQKRLVNLINKEKISDDLVWTNEKTFQATWKYPHDNFGSLLEVGFRTHCKDPMTIHELITEKMGKAVKLGFSESIVQHRRKKTLSRREKQ